MNWQRPNVPTSCLGGLYKKRTASKQAQKTTYTKSSGTKQVRTINYKMGLGSFLATGRLTLQSGVSEGSCG